MTIQQKLFESFRAFGDNTAIEHAGGVITYRSLRNNADRITEDLLSKGVGSETLIGVRLRKVEEIIPAIIGIMNARCVFVMLDGSLPEQVLGSMVGHLDLPHIITSEVYAAALSRGEAPTEIIYPDYEESDSSYVYFTSGSTGEPKGVVGVNGSLIHFLQWELEKFKPEPTHRFSQFVSPYFDAFLRDIFLPLLAGGTICVPSGGKDFFEPASMINWIDKNRINLIHCVPSVFRLFNTDQLTTGHFQDLKFILMSGEKIVPAELENWYARFSSRIQLVNLYGSTEATMIQSCYLIEPADAGRARIPIGDPIADTAFIVSNAGLKPCGPLVTGDLYVVSNFMTRGYINNPKLTAEKFLKIHRDGVEQTAYKTGDKARVLTDGRIELMGREDRQVKLRGIRIELDEIENVLIRSSMVRSAYVIKDQDMNKDETLVAFVVLDQRREDHAGWAAGIQAAVAAQLPEYMIPSKFIALTEFPMLNNGKIDHKKLLQSDIVTRDIVAPGDELESGILAIWKEILGNKPVSVEDSFHAVGGNSLSIMKLIGRIYKQYNVRITLSELFNNLTIKKQAAIIRKFNNDYLYRVPRADKQASYHVSSGQEMLYYSQTSGGENANHHNRIVWEIEEELNANKTEGVLRELIARHEALRTDFKIENGELRQTVHEAAALTLEEMDVPGPFDLSVAPLMRAGILVTGGGKKTLVIDVHPIICDGPSRSILYSDLLKLYNGEKLVPVAIQPKDHAEWEWSSRSGGAYLAQREYWLKQFEEGVPRIELPVLHQAGEEDSDKGRNCGFELDKAELSPFLDFLQDSGLDTFPGLFGIYFIFLCQLTGQEDLVIGVAASGRMQQELNSTVGMFTRTLPIRYKLDPEMPVGQVLKEIGACLSRAHSQQLYDPSAVPVDTLFDFNRSKNNHSGEPGCPGYPLSLFVVDNGNSFAFNMGYSVAYFTESDAEMLADQLKRLILRMANRGDARVIDMIGLNQEISDPGEDELSFNF